MEPEDGTSVDKEEESMTKESMVRALGLLVAAATVAVTVVALIHEFAS
jgi:hypothetical protein